jgi:CRP-like cAMP-binding protein
LTVSDPTILSGEVVDDCFRGANPTSRQHLIRTAWVRRIGRDETVYRQGEPPVVVVVLDGHLAMRRTTLDGRQLMPEILSRGRIAGLAAVASRPAIVDLFALTEAEIATWIGPEIRFLAGQDPGLALDVIDIALSSVEILSTRLDSLLYQDARRRVARVLMLYRALFFDPPVVLTKSHLPALVGTSREMTGRVLRELESEGLVQRCESGNLCLTDAAGLARVATS